MRHSLSAVTLAASLATVLAGAAPALARGAGGDPPARIESPPVMPGAVATTTVAVPVPARAREGRYRLTAYAGVRLYVDTVGALRGRGDTTALPITYAVARTRAAGPMPIVRVEVVWADGSRWVGEMEARVQSRYGIRVALRAEPNGRASAMLRYALLNTGNAADTVRLRWDPGWAWEVDGDGLPLVVPAGGRLDGVATVRWPRGTPAGELHVVNLAVTGRGSVARASVAVRVPYTAEDERGLVRARSTLFVGSTIDGAGGTAPVIGVDATAAVSADTRVSLLYNRSAGGRDAQVVSTSLLRQHFALTVQRPAVTATFGSVFRPTAALLGTTAQGDGVSAEWRASPEGARASVLVARPEADAFGPGDRVLSASADVPTPLGRIGVVAGALSHAGGVLPDTATVRAGGVRYELAGGGSQHLAVELGAMRLTSPTAASAGAAADVAYDGRAGDAALFARLHRVPAVLGTGEVLPTNAVVGGSVPVRGSLSLLGSAASADATLLGGPTSRSRSVSSGVAFGAWAASAQLVGTLRTVTGAAFGERQRGGTMTGSVSVPVGVVALDGSAEVGRTRIGDSTAISRMLRGGARWRGARGWGWAGATYYSGAGALRGLRLEGTGALELRRLTVEAGTSAGREPRLTSLPEAAIALAPLDVTTVWSRIRLTTRHGFDLMTGAEYLPRAIGASRWRMSVGVQQALDIPLPVRQATSAHGVVFEDLNGDGVRQPGEPGIPGVVIGAGDQHRQTGANGAFSFVDASSRGAALEVDAASLPDGYLVLPSARGLVARGRADVALFHAAMIVLVFHLSAPDGAASGAAEAPDGTTVTVRAADGRERSAVPTSGLATVDGLPPGEYEVDIELPATSWRAPIRRELRVRVGPGERARLAVTLPSNERAIRFGNPDSARSGGGDQRAAVVLAAPDSGASTAAACGTACSSTRATRSAAAPSSSRATAPSRRNASSHSTLPPRRPRATTTPSVPAPPRGTKRPSASRTSTRTAPAPATSFALGPRAMRRNSVFAATRASCLSVTVRCVRISTVAALVPWIWLTGGTVSDAVIDADR